MSYPPGSPGYQSAQPPGPYGASNPSFAKPADSVSRLPQYLQAAVAVLGLATYLASFGQMLTLSDGGIVGLTGNAGPAVLFAVLAALLAVVGLLPKARNYTAIVAVLAVLAALLAIKRIISAGDNGYSVGWALWLVLAFIIMQAVAAASGLLLDAGVVTAPVARPKYDPYAQYGLPPGGGYYGQPGPPTGPQPPQQSAYPSYGGYPSGGFGAPSAPSTGGFGAGPQHTQQQGSPTPPTGFPSFSPPPAGGSATGSQESQGSHGPQPGGEGLEGSPTSSSAPSEPTQP